MGQCLVGTCQGGSNGYAVAGVALSNNIVSQMKIFLNEMRPQILYNGTYWKWKGIKSKAKVSVAVSDRRRTRGKAPIFQASASCGSLPLLSTPFCSATMNAAPQSQMGDLRCADQGLNTQTRRAFPGLLSVCGLVESVALPMRPPRHQKTNKQ